MKNHCAFSKNHSCPLWTLQKILSDNDIPYPNEYDFD